MARIVVLAILLAVFGMVSTGTKKSRPSPNPPAKFYPTGSSSRARSGGRGSGEVLDIDADDYYQDLDDMANFQSNNKDLFRGGNLSPGWASHPSQDDRKRQYRQHRRPVPRIPLRRNVNAELEGRLFRERGAKLTPGRRQTYDSTPPYRGERAPAESEEDFDTDADDYYEDMKELFPAKDKVAKVPSSRGVPSTRDNLQGQGQGQRATQNNPSHQPVVARFCSLNDKCEEDGNGDVIVIHQEFHQHIMPERERYQYPYNIYG